jgi:hypothetical protein
MNCIDHFYCILELAVHELHWHLFLHISASSTWTVFTTATAYKLPTNKARLLPVRIKMSDMIPHCWRYTDYDMFHEMTSACRELSTNPFLLSILTMCFSLVPRCTVPSATKVECHQGLLDRTLWCQAIPQPNISVVPEWWNNHCISSAAGFPSSWPPRQPWLLSCD